MTYRSSMNKNTILQYRPDLDGLRGLAVILVILFHAGVTTFSGGYIGVDIFFVLSGFLISSIIDGKINDNSFTFSGFYLSRIRRLLPAFLLFLIIITIFASFLLIPDDYISFMRSAKNAVLFSSNIFFGKLTGGYFAPDAEKLHLLHTWSLSIEWQFYLIWPVIFFMLRRFLSNKISTIIILISLIIAGWYSHQLTLSNPEHSYYLFAARIFEMLAGATLAVSFAKLPSLPKALNHLLSVSSIICLIVIAVQYTPEHSFPGVNALWVCIATMAFIYTGKNNHSAFANTLLSIKPIVFIGVLSYSLYLWHWPLFAFLHVLNIEIDVLIIAAVIFAAFILSLFTWQYVEKPFRYKHKYSLRKTIIIFWLAPALIFVVLSKVTKNYEGIPFRLGDEMVYITKTINAVVTPNINKCNPPKDLSITECRLGSSDISKLDALLVGDSHARHFREFMDVLAKNANWSIYGVTAPACLPVRNITRWNDSNYCKGGIVQHVYNIVKKHKPKHIIMAQNWLGYAEGDNMIYTDSDKRSMEYSQQRIEESVLQAMEYFTNNGASLIIIKSAPGNDVNQKDCFYQHIREHREIRSDECLIDTKDELKNNAKAFIDQLFEKIGQRHPDTIFIDPRDVQCKEGICFTSINGVHMYEDEEHLNSYASRWLAEEYLKKYGNPLETK